VGAPLMKEFKMDKKLIIEILTRLNITLNDNHNDGGFETAKTSEYLAVEALIRKLKG
jgi:hypothetical protein